MTCNTSRRQSPSIRSHRRRADPIMLTDRAARQIRQLRRQLERHRLGSPNPGPSAVRREQPRIDPVMARNRLINLLQRYRPLRQIEISVLHTTAPALLDPLFSPLDELRATDRVAAAGQLRQKSPPVVIAVKDVRSAVATAGDMIDGVGKINARRARHA